MHFNSAMKSFLEHLETNGRSPHTTSSYIRDLRKFMAWLKLKRLPMDVRKITPSIVNRFFASDAALLGFDGRPKRSSSVNRAKLVLKSFFNFLEQSWVIEKSPARLVRCRREKRTITDILSPSETKRLLNAVQSSGRPRALRDSAILSLFLETGVRLDSLTHLDVGDIDLKEKTVRFRKMKGGGQTAKSLSTRLATKLRRYLAYRKTFETGSSALFLSCRGVRLSRRQIQRLVKHWTQKAGIKKDISCKSLRHSYATKLYRKTRDIVLVKEMLNHESILTTQIYTHASQS